METHQVEKVYVVLGNDLQEGFKTLAWTLQKWKQNPISIVILHLTYNNSRDFVYTPFGKLPASAVSEEKLQVLRKYEQEKLQKLLSKYIAFCGKVKAEILKVDKSDEPVYKLIVELISTYKITKLVIGLTFFKSSSWKSKNATSGSLYIQQNKPNFCEFFMIYGGNLVFIKGENEEETMDDEAQAQGVASKRGNIKTWLGKMFNEQSLHLRNSHRPIASSKSLDSQNQWDDCVAEIQNYYEHLLSLNLDQQHREEDDDGVLQSDHIVSTVTVATRSDDITSKTDDAHKIIRSKREEAKANAKRSAKAEWAILLCNSRVDKLEAKIKEEAANRIEMQKLLEAEKEQIQEIIRDIEENKNRLNSLVELQSELSNKLQLSTVARSNREAQLEKAVVTRAEMVRNIEELRRQRDVLQRRVEFCKEKDAIGMMTKANELTCGYREFSAEDIRFATDDFSERLRLKCGGDWTNVYKGRIHNAAVAVKLVNSDNGSSREDFLAKARLLTNVRHPHLIALVGFCLEPKTLIFEYMHNGSLRECLFPSQRNHRKRNRVLSWHDRIRIAYQVCSGLGYLHQAKPRPIIHGHLEASNILLDRNLVAKISGFGLPQFNDTKHDTQPDIRAFGALLMHLLTGRNWAGLVEEKMNMERRALVGVLDEVAGQWPLDLAEELVGIAIKCMSETEMSLTRVMEVVDGVRRKADEMGARGSGGSEAVVGKEGDNKEKSYEVPGMFLCPIFQEVMRNPHVAADGFSYELEGIEEWLKMGRDTSPMTNLKLKHTFLTPNHTLRSLIQDWLSSNSSPL